jgi:cell wall-associated NlpC family hydrolase
MVICPTRTDGRPRRPTRRRLATSALLAALCAAAGALLVAPAAFAKTYSDVPKSYWDRGAITWVTNQGPAAARALDDFGAHFKPGQAVTREQFARALVVIGGLQGVTSAPIAVPDVPASDPYAPYVQIVLHLKLMSQSKKGFLPTTPMLSWQVDGAVVRLLRQLNPKADWGMLSALNPTTWEPNPNWKTGAPSYLPTEVAARSLGLRFNHPSKSDALEVSPREAIDRAETAEILYQARHLSSWAIGELAAYDSVTFPTMTARQKQIVTFALKYIGYPYVWGGEYPTKASPYGAQAHGGFDCSGFDWWVMKMHFGYTINERVAADMAAAAKPRITAAKLVTGDLMFFGPNGPKSTAASVYHAALYLGDGWFIQSTGSSDGVSLASITTDSYWKAAFAWGRRVLKKGEFTPVPSTAGPLAALAPAASPTPSTATSATTAATPTAATTATPESSPTPATP